MSTVLYNSSDLTQCSWMSWYPTHSSWMSWYPTHSFPVWRLWCCPEWGELLSLGTRPMYWNNKPFRHLSFQSCAHVQLVGSPIPPSCVTNRFVNAICYCRFMKFYRYVPFLLLITAQWAGIKKSNVLLADFHRQIYNSKLRANNSVSGRY